MFVIKFLSENRMQRNDFLFNSANIFLKKRPFCTKGGSLCMLFWSFDEKNEPFFVFRLMHFWVVWDENELVYILFLLFKSLFFRLYTLLYIREINPK